MTLWEIKEAYQSIIDDETGEILDFDAFEAIQDAEDEKVANTIKLIKSKRALANAIKAEKMELAKRQQVLENQADRIEELLERHMDGRKWEGAEGKISYRKSTKTELTDAEAFNSWDGRFMYSKTEIKPMLDEIGKAIDAGEEIPGYARVIHNNMTLK